MQIQKDATDYKSEFQNYFIVAIVGAAICLISTIADVVCFVKEAPDVWDTITTWLEITGILVWGVGMMLIGVKSENLGYRNDDAGIYGWFLILYSIALVVIAIFANEESIIEGAMGYVWTILEILFPALMYARFQEEEIKKGVEKNFEGLGFGMGLVALSAVLMFLVIKIPVWTLGIYEDNLIDFSIDAYAPLYHKSKGLAKLTRYILEHFETIATVLLSLKAFGYFISLCSTCGLNTYATNVRRNRKITA